MAQQRLRWLFDTKGDVCGARECVHRVPWPFFAVEAYYGHMPASGICSSRGGPADLGVARHAPSWPMRMLQTATNACYLGARVERRSQLPKAQYFGILQIGMYGNYCN